jgi:hypothetical protein
MQVPAEFRHLAHCFHQDSDLEASSAEEWIAYALRFLRKEQQIVVKRFLAELLRGNPTGAELQAVWEGTGPDWGFGDDEELRVFLAMIRDAIE